jgi:hypothetical protein
MSQLTITRVASFLRRDTMMMASEEGFIEALQIQGFACLH